MRASYDRAMGETLPAPPRWPTILGLLAALPLVVLGIGFVFHTDFDPTVFGKWSLPWALFLLAWWLVLVPGTFFLTRFVFRTQVLEMPSGRVLRLRPSPKILLVLILGWLFVQSVEARVRHALGGGVTTPLQSDVFHPYLQNVPRPGSRTFGTNRWGFRGAEISRHKAKGTYRIFVLGGSTVFCAPLPLEDTPTEDLRRRLQTRYPDTRIEVQNAGAEWHASEHSLIKFLTLIQSLDPDLIVVWHAINDLYRSFSPAAFAVGPYRMDYGHFHGAVAALARPREATWRIVGMRFDRAFSDFRCHRVRVVGPDGDGVKGMTQMLFPRSRPIEIEHWRSLPSFERNLRDLVAIARSKGCDVLVGSQAFLYREDLDARTKELLWFAHAHQEHGTRPSLASMIRGMRAYNETSRRVAEEEGAGFVDLEARVPKTTTFFYDDVHTTKAGSGKIAEALAEAVIDAAWVDAAPR